MSHDHPGWADNIERMFKALLKFADRLINKNRLLFWIIVLGVSITMGVMDVPVFAAIVDGLAKLAQSLPGLVVGG